MTTTVTTTQGGPHRRLALCSAAALVAAAILASAVMLPAPATADIIEEIAARVNDAIVTRSELQKRRDQVARQLSERLEGDELQVEMRRVQDKLLFDMINEELLLQQARLNFDMERYFDNVKNEFMRLNEITNEMDLENMLDAENLSPEDFRRLLLRSNVPPDVLQFEVARKVSVSAAEIEAYYEEHLDDYRRPGEVRLREIVILTEPRGEAAARELAQQVVARATAGEDFAALAKELSESPSREKGGSVGPYSTGELAPLLEELAFKLPLGSVGEPIATSYGFHILKVEQRTAEGVASLPEVSAAAELAVRQQKYGVNLEIYLGRLWKENRVRVNPRYAIGLMESGGPYASREELIPEAEVLGPPPDTQ